MGRKVAAKYKIYWDMDTVEEFRNLNEALESRDNFMDCFGGDDDEYIPSLYAVLDNGMEILLQ